jgi:hypothetical protein
MSSFLFSLTENDKFNLVNKENAIRNNSNYGPIFGEGRDLIILTKQIQIIRHMQTSIIHTKTKNMKANQNKAWEKFIGNAESSKFKVKEWEVWSL